MKEKEKKNTGKRSIHFAQQLILQEIDQVDILPLLHEDQVLN